MYNEDFITRLTQLRLQHGVSARDMSLSLGQNSGYINNIECGKALPSMSVFLYICDYLHITPRDFFEIDNPNPEKISEILDDLKHLNENQLNNISAIIKDLAKQT